MKFAAISCSLAALALASAATAYAQPAESVGDYASRPVRMVVPFAPGGASDFIGRILQPKLGEALGQQVVIDNRAGASGNIGLQVAADSTPDGYTLLLGNVSAMAISPSMFPNFPVRALRDFVGISLVVDVPGALGVHAGLPVGNLKEFIAYAKARDGKLAYGSAGYGSAQRMAFEYFMKTAGISMLHVPYKGGAGAATIATLSGEVAATMVTTASLVPHMNSGKIKILAVVSRQRIKALPDVPTMVESGFPELDLGSWQGIFVPTGTPKPIIDRLFGIVTKVVHDPWVGEQYEKVSAQ
ncbi:MAG: tripartite tricarboxylate transporter substrate-binding protein, partial [Betaproteobacteria bacterium]